MTALKNMEKLPEGVGKKLRPYLEELIEIQGENLTAIAVYGSAAGRDYSPKSSDINLLAVCREVGLETLKRSLKTVNKGIRKKITAPLFLTEEYIRTSADVFPIEFYDIKEKHLVVYGPDIFSDIVIDPKNLRHQCEEEIKGKLVRIRQAYLEVGLKRKGIEALLKESLTSLAPVFANLLRIKGIDPPRNKEEIFKELEITFGVKSAVFIEILRDKKNDEKIGGEAVETFFRRYLEEMEKLSRTVDTL